jgi:hypothetical protein
VEHTSSVAFSKFNYALKTPQSGKLQPSPKTADWFSETIKVRDLTTFIIAKFNYSLQSAGLLIEYCIQDAHRLHI